MKQRDLKNPSCRISSEMRHEKNPKDSSSLRVFEELCRVLLFLMVQMNHSEAQEGGDYNPRKWFSTNKKKK